MPQLQIINGTILLYLGGMNCRETSCDKISKQEATKLFSAIGDKQYGNRKEYNPFHP